MCQIVVYISGKTGYVLDVPTLDIPPVRCICGRKPIVDLDRQGWLISCLECCKHTNHEPNLGLALAHWEKIASFVPVLIAVSK